MLKKATDVKYRIEFTFAKEKTHSEEWEK